MATSKMTCPVAKAMGVSRAWPRSSGGSRTWKASGILPQGAVVASMEAPGAHEGCRGWGSTGGREALPHPLTPEDKTSGVIIRPSSLRPAPRRPRPAECCSTAAGPGP